MTADRQLTKEIITLYDVINKIIEDARNTVYRTVNFTMVKTYWNIGKAIVNEEQNGSERAEYGTCKTMSDEIQENTRIFRNGKKMKYKCMQIVCTYK